MTKPSEIPLKIDDSERIIRVLMNPRHLKNELIKWNCFRPSPELDEVSVIRIEHCSEQFCKNWGKQIEKQDIRNDYYGLAVLLAKEIRDLACIVVFTPSKESHEYHADIKFGTMMKKEVPPPPEIKYKMEELARISRVHKDSQPKKDKWVDGKVS